MNNYNILKSKGTSLQNMGKVNIALYIATLLLPSASLWGSLAEYFGVNKMMITIFTLVLFVSIIISIYLYSRYVKKNIVTIGDITITISGLKKVIGGYEDVINFADIASVKIKNHMKSMFLSSNTYGNSTYLVSIIKKDKSKEIFVIEGNSKVGRNFADFVDLLKKAENKSEHKFKIINNRFI